MPPKNKPSRHRQPEAVAAKKSRSVTKAVPKKHSTHSGTKNAGKSSHSVPIDLPTDTSSDNISHVPDLASTPSSQLSEPLLNILLQARNEQMDFQENIEKQLSDLTARFGATSQPAPQLVSKSFAKQHEFNSGVISHLQDLKNSISSNPTKALELIDAELSHLHSRNSKLVLADRFPGSLSILESMQELDDLKKDPSCASFLGLLNLTGPY